MTENEIIITIVTIFVAGFIWTYVKLIKTRDETIKDLTTDLKYTQDRFEELVEQNEILQEKLKEDLRQLNGDVFSFGEENHFECGVSYGHTWMGQDSYKRYRIENINTISKYKALKDLLTN